MMYQIDRNIVFFTYITQLCLATIFHIFKGFKQKAPWDLGRQFSHHVNKAFIVYSIALVTSKKISPHLLHHNRHNTRGNSRAVFTCIVAVFIDTPTQYSRKTIILSLLLPSLEPLSCGSPMKVNANRTQGRKVCPAVAIASFRRQLLAYPVLLFSISP